MNGSLLTFAKGTHHAPRRRAWNLPLLSAAALNVFVAEDHACAA